MESTSKSSSSETHTLNRKDHFTIITELETTIPDSQPSDLEDITSLIFDTVPKLQDCQFIAKSDFDLNESMSAFEVMDLKMDMRLKRKEFMHP